MELFGAIMITLLSVYGAPALVSGLHLDTGVLPPFNARTVPSAIPSAIATTEPIISFGNNFGFGQQLTSGTRTPSTNNFNGAATTFAKLPSNPHQFEFIASSVANPSASPFAALNTHYNRQVLPAALVSGPIQSRVPVVADKILPPLDGNNTPLQQRFISRSSDQDGGSNIFKTKFIDGPIPEIKQSPYPVGTTTTTTARPVTLQNYQINRITTTTARPVTEQNYQIHRITTTTASPVTVQNYQINRITTTSALRPISSQPKPFDAFEVYRTWNQRLSSPASTTTQFNQHQVPFQFSSIAKPSLPVRTSAPVKTTAPVQTPSLGIINVPERSELFTKVQPPLESSNQRFGSAFTVNRSDSDKGFINRFGATEQSQQSTTTTTTTTTSRPVAIVSTTYKPAAVEVKFINRFDPNVHGKEPIVLGPAANQKPQQLPKQNAVTKPLIATVQPSIQTRTGESGSGTTAFNSLNTRLPTFEHFKSTANAVQATPNSAPTIQFQPNIPATRTSVFAAAPASPQVSADSASKKAAFAQLDGNVNVPASNTAQRKTVFQSQNFERDVQQLTSIPSFAQTVTHTGNTFQQDDVKVLSSETNKFDNGDYNYHYSLDNGIKAHERGQFATDLQNSEQESVKGSYSYTAPDGRTIAVSYVADDHGFKPIGDHIPTPPPIPEAISRAIAYIEQQATKQHQNQPQLH